jgi:DNA-binding response OmpR family regulator
MMALSKLKVLVVDDEKLIADSLTMILNLSGFDACASYSGEMALDLGPSFRPDLLISDVIMSGMTGIEAATRLRAILPSCRVLLFSGQAATASLLEKARAQNQNFEIITKPVHPTELIARLRSAAAD